MDVDNDKQIELRWCCSETVGGKQNSFSFKAGK